MVSKIKSLEAKNTREKISAPGFKALFCYVLQLKFQLSQPTSTPSPLLPDQCDFASLTPRGRAAKVSSDCYLLLSILHILAGASVLQLVFPISPHHLQNLDDHISEIETLKSDCDIWFSSLPHIPLSPLPSKPTTTSPSKQSTTSPSKLTTTSPSTPSR